MALLDVRQDIAEGREPFARIMDAVARLKPGEPLEVIAPFEPIPLYHVMEARGFDHQTRRRDDGAWHVTFRRVSEDTCGAACEGGCGADQPVPSEGASHDRNQDEGTSTRGGQSTPIQHHPPMYRPFILVALGIALTLGFTMGASLLVERALGVTPGLWSVIHAQGHGLAQLFGWAGLFTVGVAYHVVPRFSTTRLAFPRLVYPSLALIVTGVVLRATGQGFADTLWGGVTLAVSGVSLFLGIGLFALIVLSTLATSPRRGDPFVGWMAAGAGWALVAASIHLVMVIRMALDGARLAPGHLDMALVHAALYGFLLSFVLGVSTRVLAAFMQLPAARRPMLQGAFWAFNLGVAWQVLAWITQAGGLWWTGGALLESAGLLLAVLGLRVLERRIAPRTYTPDAYARYEWYVRAAYAWLGVAALLWLYMAGSALADSPGPVVPLTAVRHVVALGVVTMMIFGLGSRILPIFQGARLQLPRLMDWAFLLLNLSVVLRVAFTIARVPGGEVALAVSGVAGLAALVCFAVVIWRTLRPQAKEDYRQFMQLYVGGRLAQSSHVPSVGEASRR